MSDAPVMPTPPVLLTVQTFDSAHGHWTNDVIEGMGARTPLEFASACLLDDWGAPENFDDAVILSRNIDAATPTFCQVTVKWRQLDTGLTGETVIMAAQMMEDMPENMICNLCRCTGHRDCDHDPGTC